MSDDIKTRLKNTSEECQKCYEVWSGNDKDDKAREALQDAIHELRKVASRLEIELAISERDQMKQRPLPIPPHRDAKIRNRPQDGDNSDNEGQPARKSHGGPPQQSSGGLSVERKPQRRPRPARENGEGGDEGDNVGNAG